AFMGNLHIDGILDIDPAGGIGQFSAGSFASPATGFKLYNSGGKGVWETWLSGVKQIYLDPTDLSLRAAAGNLRLDANGLRIQVTTAQQVTRGVVFAGTAGFSTILGGLYGVQPGTGATQIILETEPDENQDSDLLIRANAGAGQFGRIFLTAAGNNGTSAATLQITSAGGSFTDSFAFSANLTIAGN